MSLIKVGGRELRSWSQNFCSAVSPSDIALSGPRERSTNLHAAILKGKDGTEMKTIFWYSKVFTATGLSDTGTCAYRSIGRLQTEKQRKKKSALRKEE